MDVIGLGLGCMDIIHTEKETYVMNGGTCLNVLSVLAQLGRSTEFITADYVLDWFRSSFDRMIKELGVEVFYYKRVSSSIPRIVERHNNITGEHCFDTICPVCRKKILKLPLPSQKDSEHIKRNIDIPRVVFFDRASAGISELVHYYTEKHSTIMYEPNSGRNFKSVCEYSKRVDILKFSESRIPFSMAEQIREKNCESKLKLIIMTQSERGALFSCRIGKNQMSEWIKVEPLSCPDFVDGSGMGDWMTAGILHQLLSVNQKLEEMMDLCLVEAMIRESMRLSEICAGSIGAQGAFYSIQAKQIFDKLYRDSKFRRQNRHLLNVITDDICPECSLEK